MLYKRLPHISLETPDFTTASPAILLNKQAHEDFYQKLLSYLPASLLLNTAMIMVFQLSVVFLGYFLENPQSTEGSQGSNTTDSESDPSITLAGYIAIATTLQLGFNVIVLGYALYPKLKKRGSTHLPRKLSSFDASSTRLWWDVMHWGSIKSFFPGNTTAQLIVPSLFSLGLSLLNSSSAPRLPKVLDKQSPLSKSSYLCEFILFNLILFNSLYYSENPHLKDHSPLLSVIISNTLLCLTTLFQPERSAELDTFRSDINAYQDPVGQNTVNHFSQKNMLFFYFLNQVGITILCLNSDDERVIDGVLTGLAFTTFCLSFVYNQKMQAAKEEVPDGESQRGLILVRETHI